MARFAKNKGRIVAYLLVALLGVVALFLGIYSRLAEEGYFVSQGPSSRIENPPSQPDEGGIGKEMGANVQKTVAHKPVERNPVQPSPQPKAADSVRTNPITSETGNPIKPTPSSKRETDGAGPMVAIIIDDFGNTMNNVDDFCSLDIPISFAILPKLPYSGKISWRARQAGKQVILHLPMENQRGINPGPGTITTTMSREEVEKEFNSDLESVPGAVGFNNHEGSKATEDVELMNEIMKLAEDKGFFFIDSATSSKSVALESARKEGVASTRRNVFLDNEDNVDYICGQMQVLADRAAEKGYAVGIGHCRKNTFTAIEKMIPTLQEKGVRFVPVWDLVD